MSEESDGLTPELVKRPPVLNKLLNIIDQRTVQINDNNRVEYLKFLKAARNAMHNPDGLSLKFGYLEMNKVQRDRKNCSLCVIFFFYCKTTPIHAKINKESSTEDIESARESLTFFELLLLLRDFRVIPNIITKEELHYLWKQMITEKVKRGERIRRLINFEDFKHFLARIAVLSFNKPGMKRLLKSSSSKQDFYADDHVNLLVRYMRLDDIKWVRNRIRTVGRETVGLLNFKVKGERNNRSLQYLRDDLQGIRLARILSMGHGEETNSAKASYKDSGGNAISMLADEGETISKASDTRDSTAEVRDNAYHAAFKTIESKTSATVGEIAKFCEDIGQEGKDSVDAEKSVLIPGGLKISSQQVKAMNEYKPGDARILEQYSDTKAYFRNISYSFPSFNESHDSSSGFLDMGNLEIGSDIVIRLQLTNETAHTVKIAVSASGLGEKTPPSVTSLPKTVAAGLGFVAYVAFTVETLSTHRNANNILGYITVNSLWPSDPTQTMQCLYPVFFRTIPKVTAANHAKVSQLISSNLIEYPLCNSSILLSLLKKLDNEQHQECSSFQTQNEKTNLAAKSAVKDGPAKGRTADSAPSNNVSARRPSAPTSEAPTSSKNKRRFSLSSRVLVKHKAHDEEIRQGQYVE